MTMENSESNSPESGNYAAAMPLEVSPEVASRADDLLREFAEDSGLETALIVDRSGALVAGISAEEEVTVDVISALVAGASGAMRALVSRLGETGAMESLHLGGDRLIYLREIVNQFILVGVSDGTRPAGLVRSKARHIEGELTGLLRDVRPAEVPLPAPTETASRPVREVALRRAAERLLESESESEWRESGLARTSPEEIEKQGGSEPAPIAETEPLAESPEGDFFHGATDEDGLGMDSALGSEELFEAGTSLSLKAISIPEPREILEPLDLGEPEIVIERSSPLLGERKTKALPVDSPFEVEAAVEPELETAEDSGEEAAAFLPPSGSVFELEAEAEVKADTDVFEEPPVRDTESPPVLVAFQEEGGEYTTGETDEDEAGEEVPDVFALDVYEASERESTGEFDEAETEIENVPAGDEFETFPEVEAPRSFFETVDAETQEADESEDEAEDVAGEIGEMIDEEEEDSEVRSSGPFYF